MLFNTQCYNSSNQGYSEMNQQNNSFGFGFQQQSNWQNQSGCQNQSSCQHQNQMCRPSRKQQCCPFRQCGCPCKQNNREIAFVVEGKLIFVEKPRCPFS